MATFTLDQLKADVENSYASMVIEIGDDKIVLRNMLRMPEGDRAKIMDLLDELEAAENQQGVPQSEMLAVTQKCSRSIVEIAADKGRGKDLLEIIGDDTALLMEIMSKWTGGTQVGEAERSDS